MKARCDKHFKMSINELWPFRKYTTRAHTHTHIHVGKRITENEHNLALMQIFAHFMDDLFGLHILLWSGVVRLTHKIVC